MKAQRTPKHLRAALAAVAVLVAAFFGFAAATSLDISSPTAPWFDSQYRCTSQTVSVDVDGGVAHFDLPEECVGEQVSLHLSGNEGTEVHSMVGELTNTVDVGAFAPSDRGVLITADTWPLRTEATVTDPDPGTVPGAPVSCTIPDGECTVTTRKYVYWEAGGIQYYELHVDLSSDSPTEQVWTATINLSSDELPFLASAVQNHQAGGLTNIVTSACDVTPRTITVQGNPGWNRDKVGAGKTADIDIQGQSAGTGNLLTCP